MSSNRSSKDLINMIRSKQNYGVQDNYGQEEYDKFPVNENNSKITYNKTLKANASSRASTSHLRNMSQRTKNPKEGLEFPSIKHALRESASSVDLEQKLKKLK
jgi:hypothetical protein